MPGRYVREALLGSPAWQGLPDAETQLLFVRLLLIADDFGVCDGRPEVITTNAFPASLVREEELSSVTIMLHALHLAGMIVRFSNRGKPYVAIWQWGNDLRGSRRFPAPPIDIDLEDLNVRGKFGKAVGWTNPPGCDQVSILLDIDGRAAVPQPPEWRPPEHLRVITTAKVGWRRNTVLPVTGSVIEEAQRQAASDRQHMTGSVSLAACDSPLVTGGSDSSSSNGKRLSVAGGVEAGSAPPVTASPTASNGEEIIKFENGGFEGLSEEQRVKWQEMFDAIRIPDQVSRAAEWLTANPAELNLYRQQDNGIRAFLVRWLLRESRSAEKRP